MMQSGNARRLLRLLSNEPTPVSTRIRDNNFDALRLIFASMVVVFHAGFLSHERLLSWTLHTSATFAVQAFFVVSGFLVTMSFENSSSPRSYFSKRVRRIGPAYAFVVVTAALGLSLMSRLSFDQYFFSSDFWRYLIFNLLLSNFSAPDLPGVFQSNFETAVNGSLWTIKIEVAFYCSVPFIVWAVGRWGYPKVLGSMFLASVLWKIGFNIAAATSGAEIYVKLAKQLPGQLCFFVGGAWSYYRTLQNKKIHALAAIVGVIFYAAIGYGWVYDVFSPIAVTAIVAWSATAGPRLPAVAKHGDISYGIYLYHFPWVQILIALGLFHSAPIVGFFAVFVLTVIFASFSWRVVEKPMLSWNSAHV